MSAAEVLTSLAAAGAELVIEAETLRVRAPGRLPGALLAAARGVKPALLRVTSGGWRLDLAGWPDWRRKAFEERAALREHDGKQPRDLAERCAYLEPAELPAPFDGPELPAGLEVERPRLLDQPAPGPPGAQLAGLEAPGVELPPAVDPVDPSDAGDPDEPEVEQPDEPAVDLADTPEAWAAFLRGAPWLTPSERRRIQADAARLRRDA